MAINFVGQYYFHPMMYNQDWGWGLFMMLFWAGVLILAVYFAIRFFNTHETGNKQKSPLDIAKERYARGEIKKDEFEQIKKDLGSR